MSDRGTQTEIEYRAAVKALRKVGTAHATGDGLRAMYAQLATFHNCLDGLKCNGYPTLAVFAHLGKSEGDRAISKEGRRLVGDWRAASDVAFLDIP